MRTVVYFFHPIDFAQIRKVLSLYQIITQFFSTKFLSHKKFLVSSPFIFTSDTSEQLKIYYILSNYWQDTTQKIEEELLSEELINASFIATDLGAHILSLGVIHQFFIAKKNFFYKHLKIPITAGINFTAWSALEAVFKKAKEKNNELKKATVGILGASTPLGQICRTLFRDLCQKLILTVDAEKDLGYLKESVVGNNKENIVSEETTLLQLADYIIDTSTRNTLPDIKNLTKESALIDLSMFRRFLRKIDKKPLVSIIEGGLIRLPNKLKNNKFLSKYLNVVPASLAEAILLVLENKVPSTQINYDANLEKIELLANFAAKHGFEVDLS
ncbi:MAG: hypothetical protein N2606_07205 [Candidatus Omnitrophica bacterium]|nr:hypothetical protein [Candidatus Omnitrophota bacterium]